MEDKSIIERWTIEGKFNLAAALAELESKNKRLNKQIEGLEEAMIFFSDWFNKTQVSEPKIILPTHLDESGNNKLIL